MDDVDALVAQSDELLRRAIMRARTRLLAGEDLTNVHRTLAAAVELGLEIQLRAVLAAGGDADALANLRARVEELRVLVNQEA